ncbi:hypothetical protein EBESD8_21660 [Rhodococcus aetherivorans]|nr:hypothetical protein EBESD8_21660 [Rhodococcus aetherivorans]
MLAVAACPALAHGGGGAARAGPVHPIRTRLRRAARLELLRDRRAGSPTEAVCDRRHRGRS